MPETFPPIAERADYIADLIRRESRARRRKPLEALLLVKQRAFKTRLEIAYRLGVTRRTVDRWMQRYATSGIAAFIRTSKVRPAADDPGLQSRAQTNPVSALDEIRARLERLYGLEIPGPEFAIHVYEAFLHAIESRLEMPVGPTSDGVVETVGCSPINEGIPTDEPNVLFGEADDLVAAIIESRLVRQGVNVDRITDGLEFVSVAQSRAPDLFLIDVRLPGLDGYQISRWIRSEPGLRSIPIILLGWPGKETDVEDAFRAGADDYILKPFSPVDLSARVTRLLGPAHSTSLSRDRARDRAPHRSAGRTVRPQSKVGR